MTHNTRLYLLRAHEILDIPVHLRPSDELKIWLQAQLRAGRDMLAAKLRVDENSLRKRELDALPELIKMMQEAKAANPKLDL